jgi:hypothetical protein
MVVPDGFALKVLGQQGAAILCEDAIGLMQLATELTH